MNPVFYKKWPHNNISVTTYIHQLRNYRYNWHENEYEIDILLNGSAEFVCGDASYVLETGDIILINPGVAHASFSLDEKAAALVIRVSVEAFNSFLEIGESFRFQYVTNKNNRHLPLAKKIRYFASQLITSMSKNKITDQLLAKASLEFLTSIIAEETESETIPYQKERQIHQRTIRKITDYLELHYSEKILLDDLAKLTKYNRTYISTLFKETVGIKLYDYVIRLRIQHALYQMNNDRLTLTEIALNNGFPDLKNFNKKFKEAIHVSPANYRKVIKNSSFGFLQAERKFYHLDNPLIETNLKKYLSVFE